MLTGVRGALRLVLRVAPGAALATLVLGTFSGAAAAPAAWLTKRLVDDLVHHGTSRLLIALLAGGALLLMGFGVMAAYLGGIPAATLEARIQIETESELAAACARHVGTRFLDDPQQQDRLLLAQRGAHETPGLVAYSATGLFSSVAGIAGYVVVLYASWPAMLIALFVTALPIALIQRTVSRRTLATAEWAAASYRWRDYYTGLFTNPVSARDMRLYGAEKLFVGRVATHLAAALWAEVRLQNRNSWAQMGFTLLNAIVAACGAIAVALAVARGSITVGDFVLFTAAVTAVQGKIVSLANTTGHVAVSLGIFTHFLDFVAASRPARDVAGEGIARTEALQDAVEFRDVWFRYGEDADWVLRGLSMRLTAGRTHALVGVNGAGKSTMVNLLLRFYQPDRGQILWDGVDIATMDAGSLRARVAGVLQDFVPYELSALENITIGDLRRLGDRDAARQAAERARIAQTIDALPAGFDTMLSTRRSDDEGLDGVTLSGGQWQRIALARAMMRADADLLILDEPNAGLDPVAERDLHSDVIGMGGGRTRLLISHRLGALRHADQIVVLEHGVIREAGTHEALMAARGTYCELFTMQALPYLDPTPVP
ncbi:MAG: ABC transporter ATP-binding protein [Pseudonocardiales bacterium]